MPSTHSTNQSNLLARRSRRGGGVDRLAIPDSISPLSARLSHRTGTRNSSWAIAAKGLLLMVATVAIVPVGAGVSSGAGTTAVAAATNDPLAVAAASALDLLRGGSGNASVRPPVTAPATSPATTAVSGSASGSPSLAPAAQVTTPGTAPGSTPGVIVDSGWLATTTVGNWSVQKAASLGSEQPSQFANAAPVSMLPAPTDVTVPVTLPQAGAIPTDQTNTATSKKTATKKATKKVAVPSTVAMSVAVEGTQTFGRTYDSARRSVVDLVVARLPKLSADRLDQAWANADPRRMIAVYAALSQVGTNYRYSGNEPGGFDCSGLTSYSWAVAGVAIPRTSTDQINAAGSRSADQLLPGDLVWRPGHIMMYLGAGEYAIDSPQTGKQVTVRQWGRTSRYGSPL